jgi:5-methylcytosine-specific restriction endonuclease McrA
MPVVRTKGRAKRRPIKPCKLCKRRTRRESGYCADCKPKVESKKDRVREVRGRVGSTREWRKLRAIILKRDRYACRVPGCAYVEAPGTRTPSLLEVDHAYPLARGGTDALDNLVTLCRPHNREKGTRSLAEMGWETKPSRKRKPGAPPHLLAKRASKPS